MPERNVKLGFRGESRQLHAAYISNPRWMCGVVRLRCAEFVQRIERVAARVGYTVVAVEGAAQHVCAFPIQLFREDGSSLHAWLGLPAGAPVSQEPEFSLMVYTKLEYVIVPNEGRRITQRVYAAELMAAQIKAGLEQHPQANGEELLVLLVELAERYTAAFDLACAVAEQPMQSWNAKQGELGEQTMITYTLPDGSVLSLQESGVSWVEPPDETR